MLEKAELEQYADKFDDEGYDDLRFLRAMTKDKESEAELQAIGEQLGMKPGHARRLPWAIKEYTD